jgi:hypothetical protein
MRICIYLVETHDRNYGLDIEVAGYSPYTFACVNTHTPRSHADRANLCDVLTDPFLRYNTPLESLYSYKVKDEEYVNVTLIDSFTVHETDLETKLLYWLDNVTSIYPELFL